MILSNDLHCLRKNWNCHNCSHPTLEYLHLKPLTTILAYLLKCSNRGTTVMNCSCLLCGGIRPRTGNACCPTLSLKVTPTHSDWHPWNESYQSLKLMTTKHVKRGVWFWGVGGKNHKLRHSNIFTHRLPLHILFLHLLSIKTVKQTQTPQRSYCSACCGALWRDMCPLQIYFLTSKMTYRCRALPCEVKLLLLPLAPVLKICQRLESFWSPGAHPPEPSAKLFFSLLHLFLVLLSFFVLLLSSFFPLVQALMSKFSFFSLQILINFHH